MLQRIKHIVGVCACLALLSTPLVITGNFSFGPLPPTPMTVHQTV
ncbi:hypothetical protein [Alicyclobacillus contaminans]|nr:hypothetical protein [Alicyclobacillus contaminans]